jgi:hypothetical protein
MEVKEDIREFLVSRRSSTRLSRLDVLGVIEVESARNA